MIREFLPEATNLSVAPLTDSRILIVDDQQANLVALRAVLEMHGYHNVRCLNDSMQAIDSVKEFRPDLIMLDLHMPHLDGFAVMDELLTVVDEDDYLPVLVLTGDSTAGAKENALAHGAKDFLSKPLNATEVRLRVKNLLQTRSLHLQLKAQNASLEATNIAFRQKTEILQSILDSMGDGVVVSDETGKIRLINPGFAQMVGAEGVESAQTLLESRDNLYHLDQTTRCAAEETPLARATRGDTVDGMEFFVKKEADSQGMFVSINLRPLKDENGRKTGGVAVVRDVTEARRSQQLLRRTMEEAERANHAKSEFLSRMSHELRTPLNSILGFAQLLEIGELAEDQRDSVQLIMNAGQHLLSLINEVLDLSRIEAGRLALSTEVVNLDEVIREALSLVRPLAQQRNIKIRKTGANGSENLYIKADRQRLRQVLLNLLSNAVKYNSEGGKIEISYAHSEDGWTRASISDNGRGICEEDQEKLFRPFSRVGNESLSIEGTGLGLALSKGLMEAMGGKIGVESTLHQGSTFWFELPRVSETEAETLVHREFPAEPTEDFAAPRTVLYVEDNPANSMLMGRILALRKGANLIGATQGRLGIDLARAHQPDLVLLDLHLPDISGEEVLRALQADPLTEAIPVAILSADATPGQMERMLAAGARSYLTKPLDVASVLRLVDEICGFVDSEEPTPAI